METIESQGYYMEKTKVFRTAIAIFFILIVGKGSDGKESDPPPSKLVNIVVILDTSDRVSKEKNPNQLKKDIVIAKGIVKLFADRLLDELKHQERDTWLRHYLAFVVPEQPEITPIPQGIIGKLKIWPTNKDRDHASARRVKEMRDELLQAIDELYQLVEKQKKFTGSDIWRWFRASGSEYLKPNAQNYIICLSDGYLDFNKSIQDKRPKIGNRTSYIPYTQVVKFRKNPNWEQKFDSEGHGLLEIEKDFSSYDVKFLMVEIRLRYMLDLPLLEKYWRTWLESMGINDSEFMEWQLDPQIVKEKITAFIVQNQ